MIVGERDSNGALHYSEGKPGVDQIPPEVLLDLGRVFTYGEEKYYRDNWKKGNAYHEFYGSALRHLFAWAQGEDIDPESNLPHLAHAMWNCMALRYYQLRGLGTDDRDKKETADVEETTQRPVSAGEETSSAEECADPSYCPVHGNSAAPLREPE